MKSDFTDKHHQPILDAPEAAVGIISCDAPEEVILLLKRVHNERDPWSGHYAFPGGKWENGDDTIYRTCIREVYEETGIVLEDTDLHRVCDLTPAGRNVKSPILVQPYVFQLAARPPVSVEQREIDSHVWLSVRSFTQVDTHQVIEVLPGMHRPVFPMNDYYIWGFTYGLLCRLLRLDSRMIPGWHG